MVAVQIAISVALGLFVSWLVGHWIGFWDGNIDMAFWIGFPALCLIGWVVDRIQDSRRRSAEAMREPETEFGNSR